MTSDAFYPADLPCHRCHATAWECIGEFVPRKGRKDDVLECAFCGLRTRVPAPYRPVTQPTRGGAEFTFPDGRFAGLTLAEADAQPNGRRYLEVLRDSNEKLRGRITEYLSQSGLDSHDHDGEIVAESEQAGATECPASPPSSQPSCG